MNNNLTQEDIKKLKTQFSAWMDIQDEKKQLSDSESDLKGEAAKILDCKKPLVAKLFKAMKQEYDGEENDLDEAGSILELIRANGSDEDEENNE